MNKEKIKELDKKIKSLTNNNKTWSFGEKEIKIKEKRLDFNSILGDTIKEKYETFMLKILEIQHELNIDSDFRTEDKINWIYSSPELTSMIEVSRWDYTSDNFNLGFNVITSDEWQFCEENNINYIGQLGMFLSEPISFSVFKDSALENTNELFVGINEDYQKIIVDNLII